MIGGDFNANVGRNSEREGVYGRYGLGRANEAGIDLIDWCEENGLAYVNCFMRHKRRGTWFNMMYGRWYELDGFVVRKDERHGMVRKVSTIGECTMSDHKPKSMIVRVVRRRWRTNLEERRSPRIKWEVLKEEGKREEYVEATRVRVEELVVDEIREEETEWDALTGVMIEAATEVCGVMSGQAASPWTIGHEVELEELRRRIQDEVNERNEKLQMLEYRRRLRGRRDYREREQLTREVEEAREKVKEARRNLRVRLRGLEREWWDERITECEEACRSGRMGDMYKILKKIGTKGWKKAQANVKITAEEFKEHFEKVSEMRYEVDPRVIHEAVNGANDLRGSVEARLGNERMNVVPSRGEIEEAMKEMKESAPGEDGVRMFFIRCACQEVKERVIEMIQVMFEKRANKWEQSLKSGVIAPLFKKGERADRNNNRGVCLLTMGSRILARVITKRLREWAESLNLMDDNQCGFRKGRSTADATQMMVRMQEDVCDYRKKNVR